MESNNHPTNKKPHGCGALELIIYQIVGLRKKLGTAGNLIKTVRGVGYRFMPDEKI
jgi:Response regulators consisting of a CheY-like receiver domain and a winged-helix DNA-binding domain